MVLLLRYHLPEQKKSEKDLIMLEEHNAWLITQYHTSIMVWHKRFAPTNHHIRLLYVVLLSGGIVTLIKMKSKVFNILLPFVKVALHCDIYRYLGIMHFQRNLPDSRTGTGKQKGCTGQENPWKYLSGGFLCCPSMMKSSSALSWHSYYLTMSGCQTGQDYLVVFSLSSLVRRLCVSGAECSRSISRPNRANPAPA